MCTVLSALQVHVRFSCFTIFDPAMRSPIQMERVFPETSVSLRRAVEDFVATRRALSDREPKPPWFLLWKDTLAADVFVDGSIAGDFACWPIDTLKAVLPFFEAGADPGPQRPAQVPVRYVVGSSWRWAEGGLPYGIRTVEEAIERFTRDSCAEAGNLVADICYIKPLGIFYVSGEGKNRVAFLARHGIEFMPCRLNERGYPAAEQLRLVAVREGALCSWVCILDSNSAVAIPYPEFTLPLLDAYGVERTKWQDTWPPEAAVMNAFRLQISDRHSPVRSGPTHPVEFNRLLDREAKVRNRPPAERLPILFHERLDCHPGYLLRVLIGFCVLAIGGFIAGFFDDLVGGVVVGMGMGGLLGALVITVWPIAVRTEDLSAAELALVVASSGDEFDQRSRERP